MYAMGEATFVAREHTFNASIGVAQLHRHQGIGDQLYHHLMDRAVRHGATRMYSQVSEDNPEAVDFAEKRGFSKTGRNLRLSRLVVRDANLSGYDGVVERLESEGITIRTLAEVGMNNEPALRRIHEMAFGLARHPQP